MTGSHLGGGAIAALITFAASRYGWHVPDTEATVLGGAASSVGAGIAHLFTPPGLLPRVKAALGLDLPSDRK